MTWTKGRDRINELVGTGQLQRIPASPAQALALVDEARRHLTSAERICVEDPQGAYVLAYDAARKAMTAVFEAQGLRPTAAGGHVVLHEAALAQFEPPLGHLFRPFNRMRYRRHQVEYASMDNPEVTPDEVRQDIAKARALIDDFAMKAIELVSN